MAWTQTDLDAFEKSIALGVKEVQYGDKKTVYQTLDEMIRLRDLMRSEVLGQRSMADRRTVGIFRSTVYKT